MNCETVSMNLQTDLFSPLIWVEVCGVQWLWLSSKYIETFLNSKPIANWLHVTLVGCFVWKCLLNKSNVINTHIKVVSVVSVSLQLHIGCSDEQLIPPTQRGCSLVENWAWRSRAELNCSVLYRIMLWKNSGSILLSTKKSEWQQHIF